MSIMTIAASNSIKVKPWAKGTEDPIALFRFFIVVAVVAVAVAPALVLVAVPAVVVAVRDAAEGLLVPAREPPG